jgi:hypothetical protein
VPSLCGVQAISTDMAITRVLALLLAVTNSKAAIRAAPVPLDLGTWLHIIYRRKR